jgi:hypothetical protein
MPAFQTMYKNASIEREEIVNLVASLVMACPNLQRLSGFHIPYTHAFDRLSYALSTRRFLRERVWFISDNEFDMDEDEDDLTRGYYLEAYDPTERFLEHNANHPNLSTLVIHQECYHPEKELTFRAIIGTIRQLPLLRHLSLSNLSATSFPNLALNALPPNLHSLRLENLSGLTDKGMHKFFTSNSPCSLRTLALLNLEVTYLSTVASILSPHLSFLENFTIVQHQALVSPPDTPVPIFASTTLKSLHWEFRSQAGPSPTLLSPFKPKRHSAFPFTNNEPIPCLATTLLAADIQDKNFPSLRRIRVPHDPQGTLQDICKPLATALRPADTPLFASIPRGVPETMLPDSVELRRASTYSLEDVPTRTASLESRADSAVSTCDSTTWSTYRPLSILKDSTIIGPFSEPYCTSRPFPIPLLDSLNPPRSRLAAQARILSARTSPLFTIQVTDPYGVVAAKFVTKGFMGNVGSGIEYVLCADAERRGLQIGVGECEEDWVWYSGVEELMFGVGVGELFCGLK